MINYGPGSFLLVAGKRYALQQFHFHRPSEERINGKGFEMEGQSATQHCSAGSLTRRGTVHGRRLYLWG
jgi:carbonic anhydrase